MGRAKTTIASLNRVRGYSNEVDFTKINRNTDNPDYSDITEYIEDLGGNPESFMSQLLRGLEIQEANYENVYQNIWDAAPMLIGSQLDKLDKKEFIEELEERFSLSQGLGVKLEFSPEVLINDEIKEIAEHNGEWKQSIPFVELELERAYSVVDGLDMKFALLEARYFADLMCGGTNAYPDYTYERNHIENLTKIAKELDEENKLTKHTDILDRYESMYFPPEKLLFLLKT